MWALKMKKGAMSQGMQATLESGKGRERDASLELLERSIARHIPDFSPQDLFQTSEFQNYKRIHLYCVITKFVITFYSCHNNTTIILKGFFVVFLVVTLGKINKQKRMVVKFSPGHNDGPLRVPPC